jgi:gas vesicle protein
MRLLFRLAILGLAAFGAKTLYEKYASRTRDLQSPANQFIDRAKSAVSQTAQQVSGVAKDSAHQVSGAVDDMTDEIKSAADDVASEVTKTMSDGDPATNNTTGSTAASR